MNDLPKVYANKIDKEFKNTQEIYYGDNRNIERKDLLTISKKINEIFSSSTHVYKSKVKITFEDKIVEKIIIGKTQNYLITIDGEQIKIDTIMDIVKI